MDLTHLTQLATYYASDSDVGFEGLPGISIYRRTAPSDIEAFVYYPVLCLILQGGKVTSAGSQVAELGPGDALLVSHDLPVVSRITEASTRTPYLAVILSLDLELMRSLYDQVAEAGALKTASRSIAAGKADPTLLGPLIRYLELMDCPLDARVLGPSILREIHYRLLLAPLGGMLRKLMVENSHASRVARAIRMLRADFRCPLKVADLAQAANMSVSSFHEHFKSVTGTTPLQYQKDLRLIEAQGLLAVRNQSVAQAAYAVGYESPTHFSRDYKRKFGVPPSRAGTMPSRQAFHDQMTERQPRKAVSLSSRNLA